MCPDYLNCPFVKSTMLAFVQEEATYSCHESYISRLEANRDGSLLLTTSTWRRPLSALWTVKSNTVEQK